MRSNCKILAISHQAYFGQRCPQNLREQTSERPLEEMLNYMALEIATIMVNFMHQFDWAEECPDSWLHISVSVRVFPDEIST